MASISCGLGTSWVYAQATFTPLGFFGGTTSQAYDVSADGSVVVGTVRNVSNGINRVFHWTAGQSLLNGNGDFPVAVSADGRVVVGTHLTPTFSLEAFRWTVGGSFETLGLLPGAGSTRSDAFDVSADGSVVVGVGSIGVNREAFRWTSETGFVTLGDLPGGPVDSGAFGISADGRVVVGQGNIATASQGFRWTEETGIVGIPFPPGGNSGIARRVSVDGSVVVGVSAFPQPGGGSAFEAFRWTESEGMIGLGDLPGGLIFSDAKDVSQDGSVIVGVSNTPREDGVPLDAAFYWTEQLGMINLRDALIAGGATGLEGWWLFEARGVSADGLTVAGWGRHDGRMEAFVATVPEPSTVVLTMMGAVGAMVFFYFNARRYPVKT
ncbi:MAG: PEP-CTERM sorting domain-containing protein [Pirellulales bacterium]